MNPNRPATNGDSLYKMVAILGLALFLSPALLTKDFLSVETEIIDHERNIFFQNKKIAAANEEMAAMFSQQDMIDSDMIKKRSRLREIESQQKQIHIILVEMQQKRKPIDLTELDSLRNQLREFGVEINEKNLDFKKIGATLDEMVAITDAIKVKLDGIQDVIDNKEFDLRKVEAKIRYLERESIFNVACRVIGAIMTISGFVLWYYKTQKHIDKLFADELKTKSVKEKQTPKRRETI